MLYEYREERSKWGEMSKETMKKTEIELDPKNEKPCRKMSSLPPQLE